MKKIIGSLALTLVLSTSAMCQQHVTDLVNKLMPKPVPQAPNVASLGKYGDYQVDHFNGIPEISIPIFEVRSGGLSVPITLSYHAAGVKPTDVASWVGMGWSLSAGGQVARNVQGKPDEVDYVLNPLKQNLSVCGPTGVGTFYYLQYAASGASDTEPDIFSYSYPGGVGKFIRPYNSSPILFPYAPIIVNPSTGYNKFEITDERGVLYRFGQNEAGNVFASDGTTATHGGNPSFSATTAWHLMDMVAPNSDDRITFSYQSLGSSTTHDVSHVYTVIDQCFASNGATCNYSFNYTPSQKNVDSNSTQKGLQTILFETGKVEFIVGPQRLDVSTTLNRLGQIKIYSLVNGIYALEKIVDLTFSYFTNAVSGNQALKLDGLQFKDKNNAVVQNYSFTYFTNSFSWNPNSTSFLNARDLWGYYNGATQNTDLIVPTTIAYQETTSSTVQNITFGGAANRNVNTAYSKEGVLKRITFPTGGYTEFDFEQNKYLKSGVSTDVGGLRVKKITSSDGTSSLIEKNYKYGNGENGFGVPNFLDTDFNYMAAQKYYSDCQIEYPILNYQVRTYFSNASFGGDSPIMYPYVSEYIGDPAGSNNGKTSFVYDNGSPANDVSITIPGSTKKYTNSNSWQRGKLTSKMVYDNQSHPISATTISRSLFKSSNNQIGYGVYQFIAGNYSTCSGGTCLNESSEYVNPQTYFFCTIYQNTGVLLETNTTESMYENGDINKFIISEEQNTFETNKLQVIEILHKLSTTSDQKVSVNLYPFQINGSNASSTGAAKGIYMLNQKNILSTPLETYSCIQNSDGSNRRVTGSQVTTFRQNTSNTNQVVADQIYIWESVAPVSIASYTPISINGTNTGITMDSKFVPRINMIKYDDVGNLLSLSRTNDIGIAYLYGYNKALPIAEGSNALDTEIFIQNFEEGSATGITNAHSGKKYLTTSYVVPFTKPNSRNYVVEYWYLSVSTWIYATAPYTNGMTLSGGTGIDDVRVYPSDARMKSYTYEPVNGLSSVLDENGKVYFYNYDSFGRLSYIKNEQGGIEKQYTYNYKY